MAIIADRPRERELASASGNRGVARERDRRRYRVLFPATLTIAPPPVAPVPATKVIGEANADSTAEIELGSGGDRDGGSVAEHIS